MKVIGAPGDKIAYMVSDAEADAAVRLWLAELIRDGLAVVTLDGKTLNMIEYLDLNAADASGITITPDPSLGNYHLDVVVTIYDVIAFLCNWEGNHGQSPQRQKIDENRQMETCLNEGTETGIYRYPDGHIQFREKANRGS